MGSECGLQLANQERIEDFLPTIKPTNYKITSDPTEEYNCIAWAAGDNTRWWSYQPGYMWPPEVPRGPLVESMVAVFANLGYEVCQDASFEVGYDKVAIYEKNGLWKHAARQLPNSLWTSKLGGFYDIEHATLDDLCGDYYGSVYCIMKKKRI